MRNLLLLAIALAPMISCSVAPEVRVANSEARLLTANVVSMDYEIDASGAFEAEFHGKLELAGPSTTLTFVGEFGGRPVRGKLEFDGERLVVQSNEKRIEEMIDDPLHVRDAVVIGWMRMGLLHNLAQMAFVRPPDRCDGTVREWVRTEGHRRDGTEIVFDIIVDGTPSATGRLELDGDGLPQRRTQTVRFGDKEMRVVETYRFSKAASRALTSL